MSTEAKRRPTPSELLAAYADALEDSRQTRRSEGSIECPWCGATTAVYQFGEPLGLTCLVRCPCGFGMRQGC